MAIVNGHRTDIGYYEYKCGGGNWTEVNIKNTKPLHLQEEIKIIYLKPTDELRFTLVSDSYWTRTQALSKASLRFVAWDMTNQKSCGEQAVNITNINQKEFLSEFKSTAVLTQLRKGCDGKAGTVGQLDACGECQGDNSTCTDCAGVVLGSAVLGKLPI